MRLRSLHILAVLALLASTLAAVVVPARAEEKIASFPSTRAADAPVLLGVRKIWDAAPHNAFTDLIRLDDGRLVCAFRESSGHVVKDGRIRVIASRDGGATWAGVGELLDPRGDLRDAKLSILPDGRLELLTAVNLSAGDAHGYQSVVFTATRDLTSWTGPRDVGEADVWLWGLKWHGGVGLSIGYGTARAGRFVRLYKTTDGATFAPTVERLGVAAPYPNENAIVFDDADGDATALVRCDPDAAYVGQSRPPYDAWTFRQTNARVGGPALTLTPDGRLLGAGRLYDGVVRTSLFWVDATTGAIDECLKLPSGGDTSYPGLAWDGDVLNVSYYSSHEGKTSIYLARVRVPATLPIAKAGAN